MNNLFNMLQNLMNNGNQNNTIQNAPTNYISDYPEVFFTNKNINNIDNNVNAQNFNNSQYSNMSQQSYGGLNFDMLKNILPLLFGKNSSKFAQIFSGNGGNMGEILSIFSKNKKEEKQNKDIKEEETVIDLSDYTEVN